MKTSKETAEQILAQIQLVAEARIRPMMGEYLVYVDDKVLGQLAAGRLFVKITSFGEQFAPELEKQPAYDGAKPAFIVPQEQLDDMDWLRQFIAGTVEQLPLAPSKSKT